MLNCRLEYHFVYREHAGKIGHTPILDAMQQPDHRAAFGR